MRMDGSKPDTLYVRMLGGFAMQWNGKLIAGGIGEEYISNKTYPAGGAFNISNNGGILHGLPC